MSEERLDRIKENVYARCSIANISGIGMTVPDKEEVELIEEIERLNNIINELNYGIKELDDMFYETFRISQNGYYSISEWELKEFTDKLQELKEVIKSEYRKSRYVFN